MPKRRIGVIDLKPLNELNIEEENMLAFIRDLLRKRGKEPELRLDENLLLSGKLDSLSIAQIIFYLEKNFGFDLAKISFDSSTFDSAQKILKYCHRIP